MWYEFRQNNSGGSFRVDGENGLSTHVILEADDAEDANERAQRLGIYFDGVRNDLDCSCCGDRWCEVRTRDGNTSPTIYGESLGEVSGFLSWAGKELPEVYVHMKDGQFFGLHVREGRLIYLGDPTDLPTQVQTLEA